MLHDGLIVRRSTMYVVNSKCGFVSWPTTTLWSRLGETNDARSHAAVDTNGTWV